MSGYLAHVPRKDSDIEHFGVKGMKWGVRRNRADIKNSKGSTDHEATQKSAAKIKSKGVKSLSNSELKSYLERMDLESRYNKLNKDVGASKKVKNFVAKQGGIALGSAVQSIAQKALQAQLKKLFSQ